MSCIVHKVIIITDLYFDSAPNSASNKTFCSLVDFIKHLEIPVSVTRSGMNYERTIFTHPCGSKLGREEDLLHEEKLILLKEFLRKNKFQCWVEVSYSDYNEDTNTPIHKVTDHKWRGRPYVVKKQPKGE